jgi:16S rRNA (uracil1498-N3)-methyltransferase
VKEVRFFFDPDIKGELPEEEARHAVKVLRLTAGDTIYLMDGKGSYYEAEITTATGHRCFYKVMEEQPQPAAWTGHLHLAMAPTKMIICINSSICSFLYEEEVGQSYKLISDIYEFFHIFV